MTQGRRIVLHALPNTSSPHWRNSSRSGFNSSAIKKMSIPALHWVRPYSQSCRRWHSLSAS